MTFSSIRLKCIAQHFNYHGYDGKSDETRHPSVFCGDHNLDYGSRIYSTCIKLTHWGRDKMDAISQTTFWNAFSWMKMLEFRLIFHRSLFLRVQLTIFQHWFSYWIGAAQAASHYLNQRRLGYGRIYASICLNELSWSPDFSISINIFWIKLKLLKFLHTWPSIQTYHITIVISK